jgi:hypothetical protein
VVVVEEHEALSALGKFSLSEYGMVNYFMRLRMQSYQCFTAQVMG